MPVVHHQTFKLADMPQARLLGLADEISSQIRDPTYVTDIDHTGHLIVAAFQLVTQSEFAGLIDSKEALEHMNAIAKHADGVESEQSSAPVNGEEPATTVILVNRKIMSVLRSLLNKVSALKTSLALEQLKASITKKENEP